MHYGFGHWWFPGMGGWGFLILLLILWFVVGRCGWGGCHRPRYGYQRDPKNNDSQALEILKERYARGEITADQYKEMKKELQD